MNPIKPHKVKKKSTEANESRETDVVRRSERLFLSSPEVDHSQSRSRTTNAVVEDIIEEMITIACQERIIPDPDHQRITCQECGKRFKKREYMLRHVKFIHRKIFKFHCQHCDYKTYRSSDLIRHMKHHHATLTSEVKQFSQDQVYSDTISKVYSCDKCNFVTKHPKNLPKHMLEVHKIAKEEEIQVHDCDQCCFVTMRRGDLVRHKSRVHREMSNENGGHVHSCDQCNYVTQYSGNLYRHKSSVHNLDKQHKRDVKKEIDRKVLGFDQCNYITNNRGILWRHKSGNHNISNLKVKAKVESTKENSSNDFDFSNLKVMESDSDSVEIFTDDSDDEKASVNLEKQRATCVSEEMKVPSDDKIWSCKTCGKILGNRNSLRRHESRGHNPPDLLECEFLGCAFSTHAKKGMASHKKKHNCERMQCPECGFSTWSEGAISVHKKWHLGEKFKCPDFVFAQE